MDEVPEPRHTDDRSDELLMTWVVADAVTHLSAEHRAVLQECYFNGRSVAEAARRLGDPRGHRQVPHPLRAPGPAAGPRRDGSGLMSCSYATWDGAYVLGSLSPSDRREFESHLAGCDACSRAVRDLAGLPGLLGRLDPEVFDEGEPEPVPDTLLPRLVDAMHRGQRRRTWLTAGLAAAAAVVVTMGGVARARPEHGRHPGGRADHRCQLADDATPCR